MVCIDGDDVNILLINYEYPPVGGGAATATREMARALGRLGHRPIVLTARYRGRKADESGPEIKVIEVHAIRRRVDRCTIWEMGTFAAGALIQIRRITRREQIDGMIAFFSMPCGPIAWWAHRATGIPYLISLRGGDVPGNEPGLALFHRWLAPTRRRVLRDAKAVIANSAGLADAARIADGIEPMIAPNGVDTDFWAPASHPPSPSPLRLLFVGRFQTQKNLFWLLERCSELARVLPVPFVLELVGDGPLRSALQKHSQSLGLSDLIVWSPWSDKAGLREAYQRSHCLVLASTYEGMPNVVLEAMASGLPVLLSDHAVHRSLLSNSEAGELFATDNDQEFIRVLSPVLMNSDVRQRMGAAGRRAALTRFSWGKTATRYVEILGPVGGARTVQGADNAQPKAGEKK